MYRSSLRHKLFYCILFAATSLAQLAISIHYAGASFAAFEGRVTANRLPLYNGEMRQEMIVASLIVAVLLVLTVLGLELVQRKRPVKNDLKRSANLLLGAVGCTLFMGAVAHGWVLSEQLSELTVLGNRWIDAVGSFMLEALTATFILFCIVLEASRVFRGYTSIRSKEPNAAAATLSLLRPAAFLLIFGLDLSLSFLPLYMEQIYKPVPGFPKELVMGLPISSEFICTGGAIYLAGVWVDRCGWRQPFLWGAILAGAGNLLAGTAVEPLQLILGRGVSGIGFGFLLIASQFLVVSNRAGQSMGFGLATLFAGIYAGNLCGNVLGAILADIFGYGPVFIIGCFVCLSVLVIGRFLPGQLADGSVSTSEAEATTGGTPIGAFAGFLSNRVVLALIFLCAFPSSVAIVGFFHYFVPIHLHALGVSQPGIGRMMMVYSLCLIYLGPLIGKLVDNAADKRQFVFFGCLLGSAAFLSFAGFQGLWAVFTGIVLLGLSSCFILPSQIAYLLDQPVAENLGVGKSLGIYRASSRIGQAVGPLIFGVIIVEQGAGSNLLTIGATYLVASLLFFVATARVSQHQEVHS